MRNSFFLFYYADPEKEREPEKISTVIDVESFVATKMTWLKHIISKELILKTKEKKKKQPSIVIMFIFPRFLSYDVAPEADSPNLKSVPGLEWLSMVRSTSFI